MTQLTLSIETSALVPTNDVSRYVNNSVETILDTEFDEFIVVVLSYSILKCSLLILLLTNVHALSRFLKCF